jgi:hypothetical protein
MPVPGIALLLLYVDNVRTSQEIPRTSTACYGDSFTFFPRYFYPSDIERSPSSLLLRHSGIRNCAKDQCTSARALDGSLVTVRTGRCCGASRNQRTHAIIASLQVDKCKVVWAVTMQTAVALHMRPYSLVMFTEVPDERADKLQSSRGTG